MILRFQFVKVNIKIIDGISGYELSCGELGIYYCHIIGTHKLYPLTKVDEDTGYDWFNTYDILSAYELNLEVEIGNDPLLEFNCIIYKKHYLFHIYLKKQCYICML